MMRIAHVSDLHVLSPAGVEWRRILFNKRITGHVNLVMRRSRVYRREYLRMVLAQAAARADQVVVTGDITNLSLESEYIAARALLDDVARTAEVTVVPGNHDVYLPAIFRERDFVRHFDPFLQSDLPELARDLEAGRYPCVKLRGPVALIALTSAVPRPPFVSAGVLGREQLAALEAVLAHPEVARRTPVLLIHHPPVDHRPRVVRLRDGLVDATAFGRSVAGLARGLVLYGHIHERERRVLPTPAGGLDVVSASGGALDDPRASVRAGFNLYDIDDDGTIASVQAWMVDESGTAVTRAAIVDRRRS
ncbi:metallophosphoesterase [Thiobacillus sp.]|uniref:metallophosphoesterase family protein n=1 Tax=Thiobacillus sp. TaxID=924 RepID=UPI0025DDA388|nr:metallophosphoesterase [Thiobacillus sp.]